MSTYSILIVDDNRLCRKQILDLEFLKDKKVFKIAGEAQNGLEALEILRREKVDICLTDINMPKMNGINLLVEIKRENLCPCVIFISGYEEFDYAVEGIRNGVFDYILKPVEEQKVFLSINRAIGYIESKRKQDFYWAFKADNIVKAINNSDWLIDGVIYEFIEYIQQQDFSIGGLEIEFNHILKYIANKCLESKPYIRKFSMLDEICRLKNSLFNSREELVEVARFRLKDLYNEFNKFNLSSENQVLKNIGAYIIENVENSVSLEDISRDFLMNKKYLSTFFKKETGKSFLEFVTFVKIERAKILLRRSGYKVNQVATILSFEDVAYFSRLFKEKTGMTPVVYAKS